MNNRALVISNLHVEVEGKEILKGISLKVRLGQVHAIMGPNGSGKSTLAYVLMGHPSYKCQMSRRRQSGYGASATKVKSQIQIGNIDFIGLSTEERAKGGLF